MLSVDVCRLHPASLEAAHPGCGWQDDQRKSKNEGAAQHQARGLGGWASYLRKQDEQLHKKELLLLRKLDT